MDQTEISDVDRADLQSHYPYMDVKLNELSVQEERLLLFHLRGMTKAAAGRAAGYVDVEHVYKVFKKPIVQKALAHLREEFRESVNSTEEKNVVDSLCKLHGLFAPESGTQININVDSIEQLEKLPDSELLKIAGVDNQYLLPKNGEG